MRSKDYKEISPVFLKRFREPSDTPDFSAKSICESFVSLRLARDLRAKACFVDNISVILFIMYYF
jgi:hypothetical protein